MENKGKSLVSNQEPNYTLIESRIIKAGKNIKSHVILLIVNGFLSVLFVYFIMFNISSFGRSSYIGTHITAVLMGGLIGIIAIISIVKLYNAGSNLEKSINVKNDKD